MQPYHVESLIVRIARETPSDNMVPQYPSLYAAQWYIVPNLNWWKKEFFPAWLKHRRNYKTVGACDRHTESCIVFANEQIETVEAAKHNDCRVGMIAARIKYRLTNENHQLALLLYEDKNKKVQMSFFEPQESTFNLVKFKSGLSDFDFRDLLL